MKKTNIFYWLVTILFALVMLSSAIPNIMSTKTWEDIFKRLRIPVVHATVFGCCKINWNHYNIDSGFSRLKEWAYAGFVIDLAAATYSIIAVGTPFSMWWSMLLFFALAFGSYYLYHKRLKMLAR